MKSFTYSFLYSALFIILPIYVLDLNYFWSMIVLFLIPVIAMSTINREKIVDNWIPYILVFILFAVLSVIWEYLGLHLDIWSFTEEKHTLIGYEIYGAPIEEFMFWFGAIAGVLLLYEHLKR